MQRHLRLEALFLDPNTANPGFSLTHTLSLSFSDSLSLSLSLVLSPQALEAEVEMQRHLRLEADSARVLFLESMSLKYESL